MNNLADLLKKFHNVIPYEKRVKDIIVPVIKERCGFEVDYKQIRVTGRTISFDLMPVEKQLIFIHKLFILRALQARGIMVDTLL